MEMPLGQTLVVYSLLTIVFQALILSIIGFTIMPNPDNFRISSDFSSLGQGSENNVSISIPAGTTVGSGSVWQTERLITLPGTGHLRVKAESNTFPSTLSAAMFNVIVNWNSSQGVIPNDLYVQVARTNSSQVRVHLSHFNPYPYSVTLISTASFSLSVKSLEMPFD